MNAGQWARAYRAMADELERIDAEQRSERRDWTDQTTSPLGRRRHVNAVRRRVAVGDAGAAVIGRRHLLSSEALAVEMAALSTKPQKVEADNGAARMMRLVGGV